jgi:hypothetical protein
MNKSVKKPAKMKKSVKSYVSLKSSKPIENIFPEWDRQIIIKHIHTMYASVIYPDLDLDNSLSQNVDLFKALSKEHQTLGFVLTFNDGYVSSIKIILNRASQKWLETSPQEQLENYYKALLADNYWPTFNEIKTFIKGYKSIKKTPYDGMMPWMCLY